MAHVHFSVEMARELISEQAGLTIWVARLPTRYATSIQEEPLEACASRKLKLWNRMTTVPAYPTETKREKPLETGKHQFLGSSYLANPNCEALLHFTTVVTARSHQSVPLYDWLIFFRCLPNGLQVQQHLTIPITSVHSKKWCNTQQKFKLLQIVNCAFFKMCIGRSMAKVGHAKLTEGFLSFCMDLLYPRQCSPKF